MIRLLALAGALALGACSTTTAIVSDSFCEKHRDFDFKDRGFLGLSKPNKESLLVNDNTVKRDCVGKPRPKVPGPAAGAPSPRSPAPGVAPGKPSS